MSIAFPGLELVAQEGVLRARCEPLEQRPSLDEQGLRTLIGQTGFGHWYLLPEAVAAFPTRFNGATEPFEATLAESRDGQALVELDSDGMQAWVTLVPACGGAPVTLEAVLQALSDQGVVHGLQHDALRQACEAGVGGRVLAACGTAPVDGVDARFEVLVEVVRDRVPVMNDGGLVDFRELGPIPLVEVGQPLMRRVPAVPAVDGRDVCLALKAARPGRDLPFAESLQGVQLSPDDPNLLCAAVKGQPVRVERGMVVEQVVRLPAVNLASGNVDFDGSVEVNGDVTQGMTVKASGDIVVRGTVEGSTLEAGGHVQVLGGVIAQARIRAGGTIGARFVEGASLYAGTSIAVDDMALQSDLQALNQIEVGVKAPQRGRLMGGSARAMLLIKVPYLGADTGGATVVQVGVNPELEARFKALQVQADRQNADEEKLRKLLQHQSKQGASELLERIRATWQVALRTLAATLEEKGELEKQLDLLEGARVEVTQGVVGAVDLMFGRKNWPVRRPCGAGVFSVVEDRLMFSSAMGG